MVANTLTFLGYDPIWQDIFETGEGDLRGVLRRQINGCKGVLQLVGRCYGAEPSQPDAQFGRVSYTQYEALYARQIGKKIWYLFLDEGFPIDDCGDEPDELRALQTAYRDRLKADSHLYHPLTTVEGLEASVLKLRGDLVQLRRGVKRWAAAVAILLVVGVAINFWILRWQRRTSQQVVETQHAVSNMSDEMAKLRQGIMQFTQVEAKVRESQTQESSTVREQVYEQLSKGLGLNVALIRQKLPQAAEELKESATATVYERANGAYVANDYVEAERLALSAAEQARKAAPAQSAEVVRALELAGLAAQKRIEYATAIEHFRKAEELTDRNRDPAQWAEIQHAIADVLIDKGQYREAATVLQSAVEARASVFGPEHPDTLRSRNRLAYALWRQGRYGEAAAQFRKLIDEEKRVLGPENPDTLSSRNGLANALDDEGKHSDAEAEHRQVLEIRNKVLGPVDPDTLKSRNNLALALNRQQKYAEAEKEFRELIQTEEKVLGAEHPETLRSRRNLLVTLGNQDKDAEAEAGFRELLSVEERVLGPEHPDTLAIRNNLGYALGKQRRFTEAESEFRAVIKVEEKVLGPEHPATLSSRMALAGVLSQQQKYVEADAQCRDVIALQEKLVGSEHPSTAYSCYKFAYQLARQGKTKEAAEFALRAATAARNVLGEDHPDTRKYAQLVQQLSSQTAEKLMSPDGRYSVEVVRSPEDSLVLSKDGEAIAKVSTSVGPVDSLFEALWSPDESYVAVNKQRSSRPGGDEMWIFALPSGKVVRKPDDRLWDELEKKAWTFIDEKHLSERGGKVFLSLTGGSWEGGKLRCVLEATFGDIEDRYRFYANVDPADPKKITNWKMSLPSPAAARTLLEYTAAEAAKHIGQKATVVGKVECVDAGRTFHVLTLDGCLGNSPFWIVVQDDASGPDLNVNELKGVTVAVSGKIEKPQTQPWLVVKSTSQIVPRTKLNPDYLRRAREKEQQGDLDGAIAEFGHAIDFNHEITAYLERAEVKMKKGDLDGAIADYDQLIQHHPEAAGAFYFSRARLKIKKSDYDGAIADCDSAIPLLPGQSGALVRAQAYSARGEAKEAKGDFAGAAGDYRMASTILPSAAIYKTKFKHAQAEATKAKGDSAGSSATYETPARSNPTDKASNEDLLAANPDEQKFEAAKREYEQAVPPGNEAARLTYLNNLAQIIDRNVAERWKTGHPNPDYLKIADAINAELKKHPTPKDSDSKKLSQLLVGKWQSPRHIYIFRRDGKYGNEDGPVDTPWRIRGNQIIYDTSATDTIILLNSEYLIYAEGDTVFFHSRVK